MAASDTRLHEQGEWLRRCHHGDQATPKRSFSFAQARGRDPVSIDEFSKWMECLATTSPPPVLAVAVSGGADSIALSLLAHAWCRGNGGRMTALTVDHRLRPESAAEATQVGTWMRARGIPHTLLTWEHGNLRGNTQLQARTARYRLMAEWCSAHGISHLLTAHHLDDQAETVLLRLKRGSHIAGLSAMRPLSQQHGITLLRPLLACPKAALVATLHKAAQPWIEDPSNASPAYERNRLRAMLSTLPGRDALVLRLAASAEKLGALRETQDEETAAFLRLHTRRFETETRIECDIPALHGGRRELALRVLSNLLAEVGGAPYPPRFSSVERLYNALKAEPCTRRTLAGCLVERRHECLSVRREPRLKHPLSEPI